MVELLAHLESLKNVNWLTGIDSQQLKQFTWEYYLQLTTSLKDLNPPKILLAESESVRFLAGFIAACSVGFPVFICNPYWQEEEWKQVLTLVQPDIIWASTEILSLRYKKIDNNKENSKNHIMIPTGGSSGKIKFTIHTWETLMASVRGFKTYLNLHQVNSFCVLPIYHISGLMQFVRSLITRGQFVITSFRELSSGHINDLDITEFCLSLVPTQLHVLLQKSTSTNWLSKFKIVFLGGAPASDELLESARYHKIRLAPTYGMTETASQIATLKPDDFLEGKTNDGQVLPHAKVTIYDDFGNQLGTNKTGNIHIISKSLCLGYYTSPSDLCSLTVDDLGFFDEEGYLHVVGRNSNKIITGGENVYPREIESLIFETHLVVDICVIGISDKYWGQAVTAIYVPGRNVQDHTEILLALKDKVSKYKIPKYWIIVDSIPRNDKGKINYQMIEEMALNTINKLG